MHAATGKRLFLFHSTAGRKEIQVTSTTTLDELKAAAAAQYSVPAGSVSLWLDSAHKRAVRGGVSDHNLQTDQSLYVTWQGSAEVSTATRYDYDNAVLPVLQMHLNGLAQPDVRRVVFIAMGAYCFHRTADEVRGEQCPPNLLSTCRHYGWSLSIILLDPEFANPVGSDNPQLWDVDNHWTRQETHDSLSGKVMHFTFTAAGADLWCFATNVLVAEYGGAEPTLAHLDLRQLFQPLIHTHGGALIVGRSEQHGHEVHLCLGDRATLFALGYSRARFFFPYEPTEKVAVLRLKGG